MRIRDRLLLFAGLLGIASMTMPTTMLASSLCASVAGNLVSNCGFEGGTYSSTLGGHTNIYVPSGWTPNAAFDLESGFNRVTSGTANSGSYALSIGNFDYQDVASLSQTITDVSGATYSGSFYAYDGGAGGDPNAFLTFFVNNTAEVALGDSVGAYTRYSFSFTGTGSDALTIEAATNPSEWYVDDVVVTEASHVPEPSSLFLLGTGIVGMGGAIRRRIRP